MLLGLRTALYPAPDLAKGKAFWSKVLGVEPYFDQPFYCGYSVGGFELGLVPDATPGKDGNCAYWGVADCAAEHARGSWRSARRSTSRCKTSARASRSRRCSTRSATSSA